MKDINKNERLLQILETNKSLQLVLDRVEDLGVSNWYIGSGGIAQTVWNIKHGFEPENGIKDYDLVYYDIDTSYEAEDTFIQKGKNIFKNIPIPVEIRNQARVHLWYDQHFGHKIKQYKSTEAAIDTWPTTATAVGVKKSTDGEFQIYTSFGLDDLLNMIIRPNKVKITEEIYLDKVNRWIKTWPNLKVIPWDEK